jgi:hypothetical protein
MKAAWIAVVAALTLAVPGVALADGSSEPGAKNASKLCKALRAEMDTELFRTTYGTNENGRNAHGKCVSKHRHAAKQLRRQAVSECRAEREATQSGRPDNPGEKGEEHKSGGRKNEARKAFRQCVREKLRALLAQRRAAVENAAQECKTEREADPVAFREKYGTNRNKRNAFGKCVSQHVREGSSEVQS